MVMYGGDVLRPPQGTIPAAVKANKNKKMSFFKSIENIQEKEDGSYHYVNISMLIKLCCISVIPS